MGDDSEPEPVRERSETGLSRYVFDAFGVVGKGIYEMAYAPIRAYSMAREGMKRHKKNVEYHKDLEFLKRMSER